MDLTLNIERKFTQVFDVEDYDILTPQGWKPISKIMETVPYDVWYVELENGDNLKCADTHILYTENHTQIFAKNIIIGQLIETDTGYHKCIKLEKLDIPPENMYDIEVDSIEHELYTNNFVSHNTVCTAIFILWFSCFQKDKTVAILANKEKTAKSILEEIKYAYENLPEWIKPGIEEYNATSVQFDNGCKILAAATSKDSIRGESIALLALDEFAHVAPEKVDEFWTGIIPTISTGGRCIIVSTPKGTGNLFYKLWMDATTKSGSFPFHPTLVHWSEVPGRDEEWARQQKAIIGEQQFQQEYNCQFQGSTITLVSSEFMLKYLKSKPPVATPDDYTKMWVDGVEKDHIYVVCADIGAGVGSDFSIINVFDLTYYIMSNKKDPIKQVAIWRHNGITPTEFTNYVYNSLKYWNDAYIICEVNPGGYGDDLINDLFNTYNYENIFIDIEKGRKGLFSTKSSKPKSAKWFKEDLEGFKIILNDSETINEITYFEEVKENVFKAKAGRNLHDDCVITCLHLAFFIHSTYFDGELFDYLNKMNPKAEVEDASIKNSLDSSVSTNEENIDLSSAFEAILDDPVDENDDNWLERDEMNIYRRRMNI
jgi:hypothetical protein